MPKGQWCAVILAMGVPVLGAASAAAIDLFFGIRKKKDVRFLVLRKAGCRKESRRQ